MIAGFLDPWGRVSGSGALRFPCNSQQQLLGGSWDLVVKVIYKVTILIVTYNPK